VRASALALKQHPQINSGFNSVNQTVIQFKTIDIAVAVSIDGGLVTPIIRHANFKNLGELSIEIRHLAQKARAGKLQTQEFKGGSFTVSNLGMFGVSDFQAIINPPQAAILAVSAIQDAPMIREGKVLPGKTLNLSLSVDHRVIDGVLAAQFLQTLKKYLEYPAILLIN
jgi:pyruvate dehydrogenase E2 component (dihydrolipoamide acetyltransferase)